MSLRVEWSLTEPPLEDEWEDVVEVSIDLLETAYSLEAFDDAHPLALPQPGWHRARYCARAMDEGNELDTTDDDEAAPDAYLLHLWPAPPEPDAILRQHSITAANWHAAISR